MNGRRDIVGIFDPQNVSSRVSLEETATGPVLHFSTPLPESLPKPHCGKWQIDLKRNIERVTIVNGTLIMHFRGFTLEIPPASNSAKLIQHISKNLERNISLPTSSYTRARMSTTRR